MNVPSPCNVLMLYPLFSAESFWTFGESCKVMGVKRPAAPLGLITVAAMLPESWTVRLIDCNTAPLGDDDLAWADVVFTGGMMPQQADTLRLIELCRAAGKPVVVGGPDPTSSPHIYERADFQVLGEAESVIDEFIAAWESGARSGVFTAPKFQADVTKTPVPRFDLLRFEDYLYLGVQYSRGCPFTCEFCDIIELYGRVPRTKTTAQMLAELEALYALGYRGHVDFVDDNLIGNKKAVKAFLPHLIEWQRTHGHPFHFSTEASLNLADDSALLDLMAQAGFYLVFVGIESPDPEVLRSTQKKQNTRRDIAASVHRIYAAGIVVIAGFIVGFDNESPDAADAMAELIEEAAIPVVSLGLLYALPDTQLSRRLEREGRMFPLREEDFRHGDQTGAGLNFATLEPRIDVLRRYREVYARVYAPGAFFGRIRRLSELVGRQEGEVASSEPSVPPAPVDVRQLVADLARLFGVLATVAWRHPRVAVHIWLVALRGLKRLDRLEQLLSLALFYMHLGPFSQKVVRDVSRQIADIEAGRWIDPRLEVAGAAHGGASPLRAAE